MFTILNISSPFYNTNVRHEQHECNMNDTSTTRVRHQQHECKKSATQAQHKCDTNDTSATRVRNFDFNNSTSENIFSHPYISYMANERFQGRKNFILRTTFWKCLVPMAECI